MICIKRTLTRLKITYNTMNTDKKIFNTIVDATSFWLGYQFKIGRDRLVHEASLRYPIADTLTGNGLPINKINLEKGHPLFDDRTVDLLVFDKRIGDVTNENYKDSILEMYEFKIAKSSTKQEFGNEHQRIIDDILRLAYFNLFTKKECYFLMCGKYDEFNAYFLGNPKKIKKNSGTSKYTASFSSPKSTNHSWNSTNSLYKSIFKFKIDDFEEKEFEKKTIPRNASQDEKISLRFGLYSFQKRYKIKNNQFVYSNKITVKTTCMGITSFELNPIRTHAAAIWKIEGK